MLATSRGAVILRCQGKCLPPLHCAAWTLGSGTRTNGSPPTGEPRRRCLLSEESPDRPPESAAVMLCQGRIRPLLAGLFEPERTAWRATLDLATVFRRYGVLAGSTLIACHARVLMPRQAALRQVLTVASGLGSGWILVAIWRCAARAHLYWETPARWLAVARARDSGRVLDFRQIRPGRTFGR